MPTGADAATGPARDRNVEQRLVNAWRQLRGEPDTATATRTPAAADGTAAEPAPTTSATPVRALLIVAAASYLTLVVWSLPLSSADDLEDSLVPLVIMIAVTLGAAGLHGAAHPDLRRPAAPVAIDRSLRADRACRSGSCSPWSPRTSPAWT